MDEVKYTEDNLGDIVTITTKDGTYYDERIVQVFCPTCAASFIGPIRHAGGFIAGHECYHKWEADTANAARHGLTP